jgi:hypothetical protein
MIDLTGMRWKRGRLMQKVAAVRGRIKSLDLGGGRVALCILRSRHREISPYVVIQVPVGGSVDASTPAIGGDSHARPVSAVHRRGLREQVLALKAPEDAVNAACRKLLEELRRRCPGVLPREPLEAGQIGPQIPLDRRSVEELVRLAARDGGGDTLLWVDGDSQLLVRASAVEVQVGTGLMLVRIPVACEETGAVVVQVAFAVGTEAAPAGLVATTETRPRGPAVVVDVWGDALTAFAWQAVLRVTTAVAAEGGTDRDGAGLIPVALTASESGIQLLTLARHGFDRVVR